jgi:hypothetical protein
MGAMRAFRVALVLRLAAAIQEGILQVVCLYRHEQPAVEAEFLVNGVDLTTARPAWATVEAEARRTIRQAIAAGFADQEDGRRTLAYFSQMLDLLATKLG